MRNFPYIFLLVAISSACFSTNLNGQQNKPVTFVTALNPGEAESVLWEADGHTEVQYWNKDYIRVVITIEESNMGRPFHKMLATKGYYKPRIENTEDRRAMTISLMRKSEPIYLNNQPLENTISYAVYAPNHIDFKQKTSLVDIE